jgi:hypothetical protein
MNQTSPGWRKRQIALDKMAENARELGLDYEPDKTVMDMAREADVKPMLYDGQWAVTNLDKFAKLVAAHTLMNIDPSSFMSYQEGLEAGKQAEREACARVADNARDPRAATDPDCYLPGSRKASLLIAAAIAIGIRARENT